MTVVVIAVARLTRMVSSGSSDFILHVASCAGHGTKGNTMSVKVAKSKFGHRIIMHCNHCKSFINSDTILPKLRNGMVRGDCFKVICPHCKKLTWDWVMTYD